MNSVVIVTENAQKKTFFFPTLFKKQKVELFCFIFPRDTIPLKGHGGEMRRKILLKTAKYAAVVLAVFLTHGHISRSRGVLDGDTLVSGPFLIRLKGIDAPEKKQHCLCRGETKDCGLEAAAHLKRLIGGGDVTCRFRNTDVFGRFLAVCGTKNEPDLNKAMVRDGYALPFMAHAYDNDEETARRLKKGVHACRFLLPEAYRKSIRRRNVSASDYPFPAKTSENRDSGKTPATKRP